MNTYICGARATAGEHLSRRQYATSTRRDLAIAVVETGRRRDGPLPCGFARPLPVAAGEGAEYVNGRQDQFEGAAAEPACHGRPRARTASLLLLRDGAHARADSSAFRRRRQLLERSRPLQHLADAPGAGGQ